MPIERFYWYSKDAELDWLETVNGCNSVEELISRIENENELPPLSNPSLVYVILDAAREKGFENLHQWIWDNADAFDRQGLQDPSIKDNQKPNPSEEKYPMIVYWALLHDQLKFAEKILEESEILFHTMQADDHGINSVRVLSVLMHHEVSLPALQWILTRFTDEMKNDLTRPNGDGDYFLIAPISFCRHDIYHWLCEQEYYSPEQITATLNSFAAILPKLLVAQIVEISQHLGEIVKNVSEDNLDILTEKEESFKLEFNKKLEWQFGLLTVEQLKNVSMALRLIPITPQIPNVFQSLLLELSSVKAALQRIWDDISDEERELEFEGIPWKPTRNSSENKCSKSLRVSMNTMFSRVEEDESSSAHNADAESTQARFS